MPDPNRPRHLPADPNPDDDFEVVDDDAPAPKPAPRPAPKSGARPAPPPATRPAPKAPPKPAFEVIEETEVEVSAKRKTAEVRKPARADRDDEDDERPRKKKAKKKKDGRAKTADEHDEELRGRRLREFEFIWPSVILVFGVVMSFTGALGASGIGGFLTIGVMVVGLLISIPLTILALMVIGVLAGIDYGRFGPAVLKIAAITLVVNGVYFLGAWFKLPIFVVGPLGCAVAFGLFKTQFDLDNAETNTSMGALNVLSFLMKLAIFAAIAMIAARQDRSTVPDDDYDNDAPSSDTRRDSDDGKPQPTPPVMFPGDEPDPDDE